MAAETSAQTEQLHMLAIVQVGHRQTVRKTMMNHVVGAAANANN
jgi:hypothetical protein